MARYELIEHTADTGLRICAPDLKRLFSYTATGLFDIITELEKIQPQQSYSVEVKAPDVEELLVGWLRELLFLFSAKEVVLCRFNIETIGCQKQEPGNNDCCSPQTKEDQWYLKAIAYGQPLDLRQHRVKVEVKAVTYHQLKVEQKKGEWVAEVIFDV